jgi:hypothetical protein
MDASGGGSHGPREGPVRGRRGFRRGLRGPDVRCGVFEGPRGGLRLRGLGGSTPCRLSPLRRGPPPRAEGASERPQSETYRGAEDRAAQGHLRAGPRGIFGAQDTLSESRSPRTASGRHPFAPGNPAKDAPSPVRDDTQGCPGRPCACAATRSGDPARPTGHAYSGKHRRPPRQRVRRATRSLPVATAWGLASRLEQRGEEEGHAKGPRRHTPAGHRDREAERSLILRAFREHPSIFDGPLRGDRRAPEAQRVAPLGVRGPLEPRGSAPAGLPFTPRAQGVDPEARRGIPPARGVGPRDPGATPEACDAAPWGLRGPENLARLLRT